MNIILKIHFNMKSYLGYYNAPTQLPSRPFQSHFQYQHETHSFSPQQSSTSDVDEVSPTSQPSLSSSLNNRTV